MDCIKFGIVVECNELNGHKIPDRVLSAEVVTPDGDLLQITKYADSNANYFISNAMDGYGNNCLEKYAKTMVVVINDYQP